MRIPRVAGEHTPAGNTIISVERMSLAFTKYHLDDGRVLHRFRMAEPLADPHDHPWGFESVILAGGYVEEVFYHDGGRAWHSELFHRTPGATHRVEAAHIHRIVELTTGECWTLVHAGPHQRVTRFWRFGDGVESRAWNERRWRVEPP